MGLGNLLGKNKEEIVYAPATGKIVHMDKIEDEVFSTGCLGQCIGIEPSLNEILSPVDGKIIQLADTLHAIGIRTKNGAEILIHIGIDTVNLKGVGFLSYTKEGKSVKKGDKLVEIDIDTIVKAGYKPTVIVIVTNSDEYAQINICKQEGHILAGNELLTLNKTN